MTSSTRQMAAELEAMGYDTRVFESPYGLVICFPYTIPAGSRKGGCCQLGISLHGNQHYPEYPPHWIHLNPPVDDGKGGAAHRYRDSNGQEWMALSRPPTDIWDTLPTKTMQIFMSDHVSRFWANI